MDRPPGITAIAVAFYLVSGYLFAVGVIEFIAPGTVSPAMRAPFFYGREMEGPQSAALVGAGWGLIGWGLWQMQSWARWAAVALLVIGVAASIPAVSAAAVDPGWRLIWSGGQMMAKVAAVWYLIFAPDAVEAFGTRST